MIAVVREALSNVARHAKATWTEVELVRASKRLEIDVRDDGVGPGAPIRRSGLDNLRGGAERRGGTCVVSSRKPTGTSLRWCIPLN